MPPFTTVLFGYKDKDKVDSDDTEEPDIQPQTALPFHAMEHTVLVTDVAANTFVTFYFGKHCTC